MWVMEHPWLTFFLLLAALIALDNIVANICNTVVRARYMKGTMPARHGKWVVQHDFWRKCSECGGTWHETWVMGKALNYCPTCGAKMDAKPQKEAAP